MTDRAAEPSTSLGVAEFDRFIGGLDYPLFVVTSAHETDRAGCLVGFVTQSSIDPPRMLVCLSVQNQTYRVAARACVLALHVLAPSQHQVAELFGGTTGDERDKFAECAWQPGPHGVPLLDECVTRCVGRILAQCPLGDHVGFLVEPIQVDSGHGEGILTLSQCGAIEPGHPT